MGRLASVGARCPTAGGASARILSMKPYRPPYSTPTKSQLQQPSFSNCRRIEAGQDVPADGLCAAVEQLPVALHGDRAQSSAKTLFNASTTLRCSSERGCASLALRVVTSLTVPSCICRATTSFRASCGVLPDACGGDSCLPPPRCDSLLHPSLQLLVPLRLPEVLLHRSMQCCCAHVSRKQLHILWAPR